MPTVQDATPPPGRERPDAGPDAGAEAGRLPLGYAGQGGPPRPVFVRLALIAAFALVCLAVFSIGWRWYHVSFPTAAIVIVGSAEVDGAEVVVTREDGVAVASGTISAEKDYNLPVLVDQGTYIVRAFHQGRLIHAWVYPVNQHRMINVLLKRPEPQSRPTTRTTGEPSTRRDRVPRPELSTRFTR